MTPNPPPSGDYVLTNFRYLSAYNELVARISQRQQTLTLFVAVFTGLITALLATREMFKTNHSSIVWIMIGFPFASIALTLLNFKYESLISILREYLAELEGVKDGHFHFPSYNSSRAYMERANKARSFHDLTCGLLIIAYNVAAIGIYVSINVGMGLSEVLVIVALGLTALSCFVAHLFMRSIHYLPKTDKPPLGS